MFWSHIHPALIHFVAGIGGTALVIDMARLREEGHKNIPFHPRSGLLEGMVLLILGGVGTGWVALAHDRIVQHAGGPLPLGQAHGLLGGFLLLLATVRTLGEGVPRTVRLRTLWTGLDLVLFILLIGTACMGEFLVFHEGLGLDRLILHSP